MLVSWFPSLGICFCAATFIFITLFFIYWKFFRCPPSQHLKLPKLPKQDFTLDELQQFDGRGPEGRILLAVNGKVFDVSNNGQHFYGKGAPYATFAGKDISRALARFKADLPQTPQAYDDLSDLSQSEMSILSEWELQFLEQYDYVGRLLRPGEPHRVYDPNESPLFEVTPGTKKTA